MTKPHEIYDEKLAELIEEAASHSLDEDATSAVMKNLKTFSECRPPQPEPEPEPTHVPTTRWEKTKAGLATVWESETTRALIKAGGAFAGVGLVVWSTIHRDHVIDRQSLSQANQRNS